MRQLETMKEFFESRAPGYDAHMRDAITFSDEYYRNSVADFPVTDDKVSVLDLGCGTGIELGFFC